MTHDLKDAARRRVERLQAERLRYCHDMYWMTRPDATKRYYVHYEELVRAREALRQLDQDAA